MLWVREGDRFNLRSSELNESLVVPGRIESDGLVSRHFFIMKKTRYSRNLLGSKAGLTASTRKLHVSNSEALRLGSASPTGAG